jgi:hypothetical protein
MTNQADQHHHEGPVRGSDASSLVVVPMHGKSTCGAHGGVAQDGSPCSQPVFNGRRRCGWHPEGLDGDAAAAHRAELARKGGLTTMAPKRLKRTAADPHFNKPEQIIAWCELMAGKIQRNEFSDYKALEQLLKLARLALDALGLAALEQLDALERLLKTRLGASGAA